MNYQQWIDWVSTNAPGTPISQANYNAYLDRAREGDLRSNDPGFGGTRPEGEVQQNVDLRAHGQYQSQGGNLSYSEWVAQGQPEPHRETGVHVDDDETFDFAAAIAKWQQDIRDLEERKSAEALRLSGRYIGKGVTETRRALMGRGLSLGDIEQLSASGIEGGQRATGDLLQQLSLQSQQAQANIGRFGIGVELSLKEMNERLLMASQQLGLGEQRLTETARQFDLTRKDKPKWWEGGLTALGAGFGYGVGSKFG